MWPENMTVGQLCATSVAPPTSLWVTHLPPKMWMMWYLREWEVVRVTWPIEKCMMSLKAWLACLSNHGYPIAVSRASSFIKAWGQTHIKVSTLVLLVWCSGIFAFNKITHWYSYILLKHFLHTFEMCKVLQPVCKVVSVSLTWTG